MVVVVVGSVVVVVDVVVVVVGSVVVVVDVVVEVVVVELVVVVVVTVVLVEVAVVDVELVVVGPVLLVDEVLVDVDVVDNEVLVEVGTDDVVVVVRTVVVVGRLVVVVVVGGGHAPRRGAHASTNRSRSVPFPRAVTTITRRPTFWRRSGPFTPTTTSAKSPQPAPVSEVGAGSRSPRTRSERNAAGGRHCPTPSSLTQTRAANRQVPSQSPSWSQLGSPSTQVTCRPPRSPGNGLSTSSSA